jgi:alkaline phosphatase
MEKYKLIMKKFRIVFLFALIFLSLYRVNAQGTGSVKTKYIFLFIGDGMGLNQVFLTEKYLDYFKTDSLIFLNPSWKFGLAKTDCADSFRITDSGAAGTAIACGEKTSYGVIGVNIKDQTIESIAEYLKKKNFKIGILTNVPLNNATPASFFGHEPTRRNYDNLTDELMKSHFDFFAGGGIRPGSSAETVGGYKSFNEILNKLKENKFNLILNNASITDKTLLLPVVIIDTIIMNKQQKLKNVYADEKYALPNALDFPEYEGILAKYTNAAITSLKSDSGFFIMVEGGKIDWACHDNDAATTIKEVIAFNDAIKNAFEFYQKYPEQTLIIITADHETGGLTLGTGYDEYGNSKINSYAFYPNKLALQKKSLLFSDSATVAKFDYDAQVGWTTNEHSALPVGVWAIGPGSENFQGIYENSEIKKKILSAMKQ